MNLLPNNKKTIFAWAFYDWANSVYPLVITTAIFPIFFTATTDEKLFLFGFKFINTELYSYTISLSFLIVSILSPFLSGIADYTGNKKSFMQFFCYLGAISCMLLYFFDQNNLFWGLLTVIGASVGFWASLVFYNAYLPEIAKPSQHDAISAKGYSLGYIGSSILLIIILVLIQKFDMPVKYAFIITGVWWIVFAQYTYRFLPNNLNQKKIQKINLNKGFLELKKVWLALKKLTALKRYLGAFFIYSMGVQTVMVMATLFGLKEIEDMPNSGMIISILIIQFVAIAGAYLFAYLSSKLNNIKALQISVSIWVLICVAAYFVHFAIQFYAIATAVGLVMGGIQSLSRSTYSKMLPQTKDHTSFFSFYDVTEKIGIVFGTLIFGYIEGVTGSMRNSVFVLLLFFVLGFILLQRVNSKK